VSLPVVFATLAAGNQSLQLFDTQFAAVAALGTIPCAAAGTNAITLTPQTNTPTIVSYTDLAPSFVYTAAATSTGTVTLNVAGIGSRNAYKWNGQQVMGPGDSVVGLVYKATFLTALNSGSGGFVVDAIGVSNNFSDTEFVIDGGGNVITTGVKMFIRLPWAATIATWGVMADQSGSISLDILRANGAVPTVSMIGAGNKPTLTTQQANLGVSPSGWTSTAFAINDWIGIQVVSVTTVTRVTLDLALAKL
jgi:hypothetical protein